MAERLYPIESTAHLELDEDQDAAYRGEPTLATAALPTQAVLLQPVAVEDRDYHNTKPCGNLVPVALLLMPYALIRYAWDQLAARRAGRARR